MWGWILAVYVVCAIAMFFVVLDVNDRNDVGDVIGSAICGVLWPVVVVARCFKKLLF